MQRISKDEGPLRIYLFVLLYCSVLKLFLGRWCTLVSDIFLIVLMFYYIAKKKRLIIEKRFLFPLIAVIIIQIIAILEVFHPNISNKLYSLIEYRKSYFQLLSIVMCSIILCGIRVNLLKWLEYIGNISVPIILYGIKQHFSWNELDTFFLNSNDADYYTLRYNGEIRSVSIFSGPFHYGLFCTLMFALYFYLTVVSTNNRKRIISRVFCLISVAGCYCSYTRTNLIGIVSVLAVWCVLYYVYEKKASSRVNKILLNCIIAISGGMIVSGTLFSILPNNTLNKMIYSVTHFFSDSRFTGRYVTWGMSKSYIMDSPIIGWGMGSAGDTLSLYKISNVYTTTHSMYYKIWMETGILGFALYLGIFLFVGLQLNKIQNYRNKSFGFGVLAIILLNGIVGSTISTFPCITLFWIIIMLLICDEENDHIGESV